MAEETQFKIHKALGLPAVALAALFEEIIFRGPLVSLPAGSVFLGIVISSLAFALSHLIFRPGLFRRRPSFAVFAFLAGALFASVTVLTKSIAISVLLHLAFNLIAVSFGKFHLMLYIDPGTGFMLFTVLTSVISAAVYSVRLFMVRAGTRLGGKGKTDEKKVPFAIFSDNKRYWNVFEPVCRELDRMGKHVLYLTSSEDDAVFSCGLKNIEAEYIGEGNKAFSRLNNLNAAVVLSTTPGLDVYQWKRAPRANWYVHIPHAASELILYRMFGLDYYDAVMVSGKYQEEDIRALEELRHLPAKEMPMIGIPYMDKMAERLKKEGPAPDHPRTVLLAPSWGKSALFGVYGGRIIELLLKTGYHVIVRPHPQSFTAEKDLMDSLMKQFPESDQLEWNRDTDNFDVLRRSDILISDFSGVIFDYTLIYDKPVIYTDPDFDLAPYDAWWLKKDLWTVSALPRLGARLTEESMKDIKGLIDECISDPRYAKGRRAVKEETWQNEGIGAALAADYLCEKYEELTKEAGAK